MSTKRSCWCNEEHQWSVHPVCPRCQSEDTRRVRERGKPVGDEWYCLSCDWRWEQIPPRRVNTLLLEGLALGIAGLVERRRSRSTGTIISIVRADEAGLEAPEGPWACTCEDHGIAANFPNLDIAREWAAKPWEWCDACALVARRNKRSSA